MKHWIAVAGILCVVAGCATQDQLRQTEVQQGQAVQALRVDADRSERVIADLRTEMKRTQDSVHELEVGLADVRARTDTAKVQADSALSTSREFLSDLLAAREEQRRQLDENGVVFADLRRRLSELDSRLQTQQRLLEQHASVLNDASRRLYAVEARLQEAGRRSTSLEAEVKAEQEADDALTRQLATLRKQVEETRSVVGSQGLLQMMRELEDVRRNSASMRGSIEELQKGQVDAAEQARNYYRDLDTRVRQLKQPASSPARAVTDHQVSQ
jgi:chromosome segregation ATPase